MNRLPYVVWHLGILLSVLITCCPVFRGALATEYISENTVITEDLLVTQDHGIIIEADNITIDGNGHSIIFRGRHATTTEGFPYECGIDLSQRSNVVIKNFSRISGFVYGILGFGGDGNEVTGCRISDNALSGILAQGITIRNNVLREPHRALGIYASGWGNSVTDNVIIGSRLGIFTFDHGCFERNRFLHQSHMATIEFEELSRSRGVGENIPFSFQLKSLNGSPGDDHAVDVRTVPDGAVQWSRSGNLVTGYFTPVRTGVHSLIVTATDAAQNEFVRALRFLVGPTAEASVTYYLTTEPLSHGQIPPGSHSDAGALKLLPPENTGTIYCGAWIQQCPDELPDTPVALIRSCDFNTFLKATLGEPGQIGLQRNSVYDAAMDQSVPVTPTLEIDTFHWTEYTVDGLDWMMDYPHEWYHLAAKYTALGPAWACGDPGNLSHVNLHFDTPTTPAVKSTTNQNLLVLGATADPSGGSERITVWGHGDQASLQLGNLSRPLLQVSSEVRAGSEVLFTTGLIEGEQTFTTVPLTILPSQDGVNIQVTQWSTGATGQKQWTESAVGTPGPVLHTVGDLVPTAFHQVTTGGTVLLTGAADGEGSLSFLYDGVFPAVFTVVQIQNRVPTIESGPIAVPNPVTTGQDATFSVAASDADNDPLSYAWNFGNGQTSTLQNPTHAYAQSGTFTATVTVSDGKGGTLSESITVEVIGPTCAITVNAVGNGTVQLDPDGGVYPAGTVATLTAIPGTGALFSGWSGDLTGSANPTTVTMDADKNVTANFTTLTYTIAASSDAGGSIDPSGTVTAAYGTEQTFTITPNPGYAIADVRVDGISQGAVASYAFNNVISNHTIEASFSGLTYTITASASAGGAIDPSGALTVAHGTNQTFTITPYPGYAIADVLMDGVSQGAVASYAFSNVTANHTIEASLSAVTPAIRLAASAAGVEFGGTFTVTVLMENAQPFANWAEFLCFDTAKLELVSQAAGDFAAFVADGRGLSEINASGEVRARGSGVVNNAGGNGSLGVFTFRALATGTATVVTENKSLANIFGNVLVNVAGTEMLPEIANTLIVEVTGPNPGDLNDDAVVNIDDLVLVTRHFGQTTSDPAWDPLSDANGDGIVNITDLTLVTSNFGKAY